MKTMTKTLAGLALAGMIAMGVAAQTPAPAKPMTAPKHMTKTAHVTKSDSDIQADIQKRLAASPKLKSENISASVSGGVAIFTGAVKNAGSKGGVTRLAKAAGAKSVVNNITVEHAAKPMPAAKHANPAKK
ncbi:MAG: BON domain-containing protein [Blastocatellales bacterium]